LWAQAAADVELTLQAPIAMGNVSNLAKFRHCMVQQRNPRRQNRH
jgi:hypothetical protein